MNRTEPTCTGRPMPLPYLVDGPNYTPGASPAPGAPNLHKLASNESPVGASPSVQQAIHDVVVHQHLYPDPDGAPLSRAIAGRFGLEASRVITAPGSDAIINWLIQGWVGKGDVVVHSAHGFQSYRIRAVNNGAVPIPAQEQALRADPDALLAAVTPRTRILFLANPNNPTGTYLPLQAVRDLRQRLRSDVLLVVDEAYFDYVDAPGYASALSLVDDATGNVVVTRTFSKFFGLAGLRVGWAYVPTSMVAPLGKVRGPFVVSRIAIEAAVASLDDQPHQELARSHNLQWRVWLQQHICDLGYRTTDSVGNFVLFQVPGGNAAALQLIATLASAGYLCRLADQNALPDWIRVSVGTAQAMEGFVQALTRLGEG